MEMFRVSEPMHSLTLICGGERLRDILLGSLKNTGLPRMSPQPTSQFLSEIEKILIENDMT